MDVHKKEMGDQAGLEAESRVLTRLTPQATTPWTIQRQPTKRELRDSPIVNLGSSNCTCVMAGTSIRMADGSSRMIETFVGGEEVSTLRGTAIVKHLEVTKLGLTRRVIELPGARGESLFLSDEHPLWTLFNGEDGAYQWWGTYNFNHYMYEKSIGHGVTLERDAIPLRFDIPSTFAHVDGWRQTQPIYHLMSPDTPLYHLVFDQGCSYIAAGFVMSSHASQVHSAGVNWRGIDRHEMADDFIQSLRALA